MFALSPGRLFAPTPDLISPFLALPELRGFWPMSSVNESGNALDLSGQGRTLTNNAATPRAIYGNFVNYYDFNGTTQYLSRADETGLDITGALTAGVWLWLDVLSLSYHALAKRGAVGQFSWDIVHTVGTLRFRVSDDGTNIDNTVIAAATVANQWIFCVGRFIPSTEITIFTNGTFVRNTTSIVATLFDSSGPMNFGAQNAIADWDGRMATGFLCAANLPDDLILSLYDRTRGAFNV